MEDNGLLHPCHYAFRKGLSTVDAMAVLYEEWMNAMERREQSVMISIDMSAAFDMVKHDILLNKLRIYELHDESLAWMSSYSEFRSQFVSLI